MTTTGTPDPTRPGLLVPRAVLDRTAGVRARPTSPAQRLAAERSSALARP